MIRRAVPALVLIVAGLVGLVVVGRDTPVRETPFFSSTGETWMPAVGVSGSLSGSWFCPGVPAGEGDGVGGEIVVTNDADATINGTYTVLTADGPVADDTFAVDPWAQTRIDVGESADGADYASVVVETEGGSGFVEQIARHPRGDSVAACSNETSANWYLADGYTVDDSTETLILTNPFDEPVTADLRFSTESRQAEPTEFDGFIVEPRSVSAIRVADFGARDEPVIAVAVEARTGRLVVGRAQEYDGGGRLGYDVSLAAPALRDQWWFADGERGDDIVETYSIYNPTDDEVEVDVFFGGLPLSDTGVNERDPIVVPPRRAVVYDPTASSGTTAGEGEGDETPADTETSEPVTTETATTDGDGGFVDFEEPNSDLPEGRHASVFSTIGQPAIVVDRVLTRPSGDSVSTTVVQGATVRPPNGFVPNTWWIGVAPSEPTEDALVVWNIDQAPSSVDVSVVGPDGPSPVPSLTGLELAEGGIITIDLVDPDVLDRELVVTASTRVFVERLLPRGEDLPGRSGSWPLPQAG